MILQERYGRSQNSQDVFLHRSCKCIAKLLLVIRLIGRLSRDDSGPKAIALAKRGVSLALLQSRSHPTNLIEGRR
ncbi:hypothetical protein [uncultured Nostoc sp.]|uniref:hypothetical protein n=1 Tax=uncultured Nostoc sp. TaxID=340711 RepID=UPI0035CAEC56